MISRRTLIVIIAVGLLILGATPRFVSADITGNSYDFSAVWVNQRYQIDNIAVYDETMAGGFQILVTNITASDSYEYTFTGLNYNFWTLPFYDERDGSVAFQDNKVYFNLDTTDVDADNLTESYDIDMYPYYSTGQPGSMFFVNPVWSTHNTDWTDAVENAETQPGVTAITESASGGSFSFQISVAYEQNHTEYNYMTGTISLTFNAAYDNDGVLSSWALQQVRSSSNENHTIVHTINQSFARGTGAGAMLQPSIVPAIALAGGLGIGGLILGVAIGKKYWG
ncbi:MAG: hypothetical protein ACFFEM_09665 [Candidatus Thorarchaeota archaeon]